MVVGQFENQKINSVLLLSELCVFLGDLRVKSPFNAENGEIDAEFAEKKAMFYPLILN